MTENSSPIPEHVAQPRPESASQPREEVVFDTRRPLEAFQTQLDARKALRKIIRG